MSREAREGEERRVINRGLRGKHGCAAPKRCDGAQIFVQGAGVDLQAFATGPQRYAQLIARMLSAAFGMRNAEFKAEFGVVSTVSDILRVIGEFSENGAMDRVKFAGVERPGSAGRVRVRVRSGRVGRGERGGRGRGRRGGDRLRGVGRFGG